MTDTWNELLEFETRDLVKRYFSEVHQSVANAWKIKEVTANFIQGREYFRNAAQSNITVRPLLIYYGVLSLSRGLILTLNPKLTEKTLKGSHGIEIKNWEEILKSKEFEKISISVEEGTFSELISATQNVNYLRAGTDGINWKSFLSIPEKGYKLTLEQVYGYFPDLAKEFEIWTQRKMPFVVIEELRKNSENRYNVKLSKYGVHEDLIDLIFPRTYCRNRELKEESGDLIVSYDDTNWSPNITQKWHGPFDLGDPCAVPVQKEDKGLNTISAMFALSYTFGMMARYFPSSWIALGRVEQGDRIYPLINRTLKFISEMFPIVTLNFLRAPYKFEETGR